MEVQQCSQGRRALFYSIFVFCPNKGRILDPWTKDRIRIDASTSGRYDTIESLTLFSLRKRMKEKQLNEQLVLSFAFCPLQCIDNIYNNSRKQIKKWMLVFVIATAGCISFLA